VYSPRAVVSWDSQLAKHCLEMSQIGAHVRGIPKAEAYTGSGKDELEVIGVTDHHRLARWIDDRRDVPLLHDGYGRLGTYQAELPGQ